MLLLRIMAFKGVGCADGGGRTIFACAELLRTCGYDVCLLMDSDLPEEDSLKKNLLQAGVDISTIAIWLGHSSIETTHKYMVADLDLKRKAMESVGDCGNKTYNYKPSKDSLEFLKSL